MKYATASEIQLADKIKQRENDWRKGAVVYQVLVDRFAPSENLEQKQTFYQAPKVLKGWDEVPEHGEYLENERLWSHEIEFWGGDLPSVASKLDYIKSLDVDVLYLNPIHLAYTNHKYDSLDFNQISPEFGTRQDLIELASKVHEQGMKIVLDGVFNHMGQNSAPFKCAESNEQSPYRDWFYFGEEYGAGHRAWFNAANLPELNLENIEVRNHIYLEPDSVVLSYLADGIDGWRLDVAHDIGFNYLKELTDKVHDFNSQALVIGEVWSYPEHWLESVDGIMNLSLRHVILQSCLGDISPRLANLQIAQMVEDSDFDALLTSWLLLDNHDTVRLPNILPKLSQRKLAQVMQMTLPASPNLYYGSELGMTGGDDPEMRAPMRWDLVTTDNPNLAWTKHLLAIRRQQKALRIGEYKLIHSDNLIAFIRYTEKVEETCIVVINPQNKPIKEQLMVPYSKLMNMGELLELLGEYPEPVRISASFLALNMPAQSAAIFKPDTQPVHGYTTYKRVL